MIDIGLLGCCGVFLFFFFLVMSLHGFGITWKIVKILSEDSANDH